MRNTDFYEDINYYAIEKELLSLDGVAVRDLLITGPKGSVHISTTNSTMIPDTYRALDNDLGLNLNAAIEMKIKTLDTAFYELIINNKKMEEETMSNKKEVKEMNHEIIKELKLIKMGELKAILNNVDADGKIKNNCIALAKNDNVLLRTNGAVIYGLYDATKQGNFGTRSKNLIQFTHDLISENPYVNTTDYVTYKPLVLKAYREIFDDKAKLKLEAVRYIISNHKWYREQLAKVEQKDKESKQTVDSSAQEEVVTTEPKTIEKEEVKEMNKELNVMALAHKLRRELGLEGDYRAQMKMAMCYAWSIIKGVKSLEDILGSTEAAAHTYNVANTTGEQEAALSLSNKEDEEIESTSNVDKHDFELMMHQVENGFQLGLTQSSTGKMKMLGKVVTTTNIAAAYLYVGNNIENIVKVLPKNTKLHALPLTITACKTRPGLKDVCLNKGLTYEAFQPKSIRDRVKNSAPSGEAV